MKSSGNIQFLWEYDGEDRVWLVLKRFGDEWLCECIDNISIRAKFPEATIRFGQFRLHTGE